MAETISASIELRDNASSTLDTIDRGTHQLVDDFGGLGGKINTIFASFVSFETIKKSFDFMQDCTEAFNTQLNAENQLLGVLANTLDQEYAAQFDVQTSADTTGAINDINDIQNSINEVAVPVSAEQQALQVEFDAITSKASEIQSKGIYGDEAMIAAGAEFATYFTDTDAIEMMMDTLSDYAMGMTGGGEIDSTAMVDYATNLGKIMTGSYDAMTKKGFEFTEAQQAIIEGEATREQIAETLGEEYVDMSSDMQAAAAISQVIDESWSGLYQTMSDTPEGKIIQLNNAWGDMKEIVGGQLYPYIIKFVSTITQNWGTIETIVNAITEGLGSMLTILGYLIEGAINVANVMIDNWSYIQPIIIMIVGALAAYIIALGLSTIANGAAAIATTIHNAKLAAQAKMTFSAAAAQYGFNAALLACPLTWIVVAIIAVIAVIYAAVGAINKATGSTISATGVIMGVLAVAVAFIWNLFLDLLDFVFDILNTFVNAFVDTANFFANVFTNPISSVIYMFQNMGDTILSIFESVASAIDSIFGTDLASSWSGWRDDLKAFADKKVAELAPDEDYQTVVNDLNLSIDSLGLERKSYSDAYNSGYNLGKSFTDKLDALELGKVPELPDLTGNNSLEDTLGEMAGSVDDIAQNTEEIKNNSDIVDLIKDYHSRQATQGSTTQYVTIDMSGQTNHINKSMELSEVMDGIVNSARQAAAVMTEGV